MPATPVTTTVHVHANVPFDTPPTWAVLQRRLIDAMNDAVEVLRQRYLRPDGTLLWPPDEGHASIDALDDAYESFHNWPLFYLVGGADKFLDYARHQFEVVTRQFTRYTTGRGYPMVVKEYQPAYDWFHQGEGNLFFYLLCLADADNEVHRRRAQRFAGFYLGDDPQAPKYDAQHRIIRCAHNGSVGPAFWNFAGTDSFVTAGWGLPFCDVPGVREVADLDDPATLRRYARIANDRRGRGDAVVNLAATSLATVAFLLTGDERYRTWVQQYTEAWLDRLRANGGILPDNVSLEGEVGGHMDGRWYGANYGWTHPHGWRSVGAAAAIAAQNTTLLTGDRTWLTLLRSQIDQLADRAIERDGQLYLPHRHGAPGQVHYRAYPFLPMLRHDDARGTPEHRGDWSRAATALERDGWFDFAPLHPEWLAHLWTCSMDGRDLTRAAAIAPHDPQGPLASSAWTHQKDQAGCHGAWLAYLRGQRPDYPEAILRRNLEQVEQRLQLMRDDTQDPATYNDSYLQQRNPITLEGLVTLTMGGPLPVYNGGLPHTRLRHFDPQRRRPGLPPDVAALVSELHEDHTVLELCNLHRTEPREVTVQAGCHGEHRFTTVRYERRNDRGRSSSHINGRAMTVRLEPNCHVRLEIGCDLYCS